MCKKENTNQHTRELHKKFCSIVLVSHFNIEHMLIFIIRELDNIIDFDAIAYKKCSPLRSTYKGLNMGLDRKSVV